MQEKKKDSKFPPYKRNTSRVMSSRLTVLFMFVMNLAEKNRKTRYPLPLQYLYVRIFHS